MHRILITTSNNRNALEQIAKDSILNKNICPCAHITSAVNSFYMWDDNFVSEDEYLLIIKCESKYIGEIEKIIKNRHNYDVPEIISVDFDIVSKEYKEWFNKK